MAKPRTSRLWFVTLAEVEPRGRKYGYEKVEGEGLVFDGAELLKVWHAYVI
jgi:hypothetical protein